MKNLIFLFFILFFSTAIAADYQLTDTPNILISSPINGQTFVYNSSTGLWENGSVSAADSTWVSTGNFITLATISDSVGIGTNTPGAKLHVSGNVRMIPTIGQKLMFGDGDTYISEVSDDNLILYNNGVSSMYIYGSGATRYMQGATSDHVVILLAGANSKATATNPNIRPFGVDSDVGLGYVGSDEGCLIAGGLNALSYKETSGFCTVTITDTLKVNGYLAFPDSVSEPSPPSAGVVIWWNGSNLLIKNSVGTKDTLAF